MEEKPFIQTTEKKNTTDPKGWYSRGYLPHFDGGDVVQFVTFRLYDSLPGKRIADWKNELAHFPEDIADKELMHRIEKWMDHSEGECWLKNPEIASRVQNALFHFDGERYSLYSWVIIPNHVHVLFGQMMGCRLPGVVQSWKTFTARIEF